MKPKPSGSRFRNLYAYRGSVWYERRVGARRYRLDLETTSWHEAAERRDAWEEVKGIPRKRVRVGSGRMPTFAEFTTRYLAEDTAQLAETTRRDRSSYLREGGPLLAHFGELRLDEIDAAALRTWWGAEVEQAKRTAATGRHYVNVLAAVLAYAKDLGILAELPVDAFREQLRRRGRTKRGRAEATPGRKIRPVEDLAALGRIVAVARAEGAVPLAFVLLQLDAGLRQGEALGLRWGRIGWGEGRDDLARHLLIDSNRPRGWDLDDDPKSGRARKVGLSLRLRSALQQLRRERFHPGPDVLVLEGLDPANFRHREWRRILDRAGAGKVAMKDLRDTFASQLLTAGVQLGYVSHQLGHAKVDVTGEHYARWAGGEEYRAPMVPGPGELPADMLARLAPEVPTLVPTTRTAEDRESRNPRPNRWNLERETGFEPATLSLGS